MVALPLREEKKEALAANSRLDEDLLLQAIANRVSQQLARALGWFMKGGEPYRMKVNRAASILNRQKMIRDRRGACGDKSNREIRT